MTGPTHIAIAVTCGIVAGLGKPQLALMAGGAILPDLDHPQSFIGRVLFPLSVPLNKFFGHRGAFHSFWLWGLVCACGLVWRPFFLIGLGCILHVLADCATVSGVRAMAPWSERLFVIFRRSWRIKSGSPNELIVLMVFGSIAWAGGYVGAVGGLTSMIGHLTGSPKIMMEQYQSKGLLKCYVEAKVRRITGEIENGKWLIIGTEGQTGLAMLKDNAILHIPADGQILRAKLKPTTQKWDLVSLNGWAEAETEVYYLDGKKWHRAGPGQVVWGRLLGDKIKLRRDI